MKYCTSYHQTTAHLEAVNEVRYSAQALTTALDFLQRHADKKIIVEILDLNAASVPSIEKLQKLQTECATLYLDFYNLSDLENYSKYCKNYSNDIHIMYHHPAVTWALVQILIYYKVSDILIGEPLIFCKKELMALKARYNLTIRAIPASAQNALGVGIEENSGLRHFWILPQHVPLYEDYIDVLDILSNKQDRESALLDIYLAEKPYIASLQFLIDNIDSSALGAWFDESFVSRRFNCGQRCLTITSKCNGCILPVLEAKTLKQYTKN